MKGMQLKGARSSVYLEISMLFHSKIINGYILRWISGVEWKILI